MLFLALRSVVAGLSLLSFAGCDQWHLSVNSDGLVFISVIGDEDRPRDRFRLRTRTSDGVTRVRDVPASGRLTLRPVAAGDLEITLLPPDGCRVTSENPRTLTVAAHEAIELAFDVRCS
jgi:hypothetical protein